MGKKAIEILIGMIENKKNNGEIKTVVLDTKLVVRGST